MLRNAAAMLCAAMLVWSAAPVGRAQAGKTYQARLSPMPVDGPPMMATIAGGGSVTAVLTGNKLTITGTFTGLKSPATAVKIHRGIKGVRGPAVLDLPAPDGARGRTRSPAAVDLTPSQVDDLGRERLYMQLNQREGTRRQSLGLAPSSGEQTMRAVFFTGGGAPPPPRTDADASPRISCPRSAGRRRYARALFATAP